MTPKGNLELSGLTLGNSEPIWDGSKNKLLKIVIRSQTDMCLCLNANV